jgi:hypothetical protein
LKRSLIILAIACLSRVAFTDAAVIYTYDFPGTPGSGLAVDQTNPQPSGATFGDFTRTGVVASGGGAGIFDTKNFSLNSSIDPTQWEGFSISAGPGATLGLTQLSFDITMALNGPANFEVALYLNGSATEYASAVWDARGLTTTLTFNFTALTPADNVTDATFKFYGWNNASLGAHVILDNVATSGTIDVVPEPSNLWVGIAGAALSIGLALNRAFAPRKLTA